VSEEFDNLYDPNSDDYQPETRSLDWVIFQAIQTALADVHTWLPAKIVAVRQSGYVDVQPLLKRKYTDGNLVDLPVIQNIPVECPRGANWVFKPPYAVGDTGRAIFCERSLDAWKSGDGGAVDPNDPRRFDLSDAVFSPGLYPSSKPVDADPEDMVLNNGGATITLEPGGKFLIANEENELLAVLAGLVDTLVNAKVLTGIGPQPFTADTIINLTEDQGKINTLKGD
jgi:hypothetical protein